MNFTDEHKSNKDYVVCKLKRSSNIDTFVLGMLMNNNIEGVLSFTSLTLDDDCMLSFDTTGKLSLEGFLKNELDKSQILGALISTISLMNELYEFDIDSNYIVFDFDRVYVDKENLLLEFICLPVEVNDGNNLDVIKFLKEIILSVNFTQAEGVGYVAEILSVLNLKDPISNAALLSKLIEMKSNDREVVVEKVMVEKAEEIINSITYEANVDPVVPNEKRKYTNKSPKIKPINCKNQPKWNETLINFFTGKGSTKKVGKNNSPIRRKKLTEKNQTTILNPCSKKHALLVRQNTYEQIPLAYNASKPYKIGTNKGTVDYVVSDNSAISRNHAVFTNEADGYYIIDNDTTNGTFVNDKKVERKYGPLKHMDRIVLANEPFEFQEM